MPASVDRSAAPYELSHLIGGLERSGSGPATSSTDPWTQQPVAVAQQAGRAEVDLALQAAERGQREMASLSWVSRAAILERAAQLVRERAEDLAALVVREVGKPVAEARGEVTRVGAVLAFYAQEARRAKGELIPADEPGVAILTRRRPLGTVLAITPWNFPLAIPVWKIAPALVCGNAVVWKPASAAIGCADALARCLLDAGLPPHALSLVIGGGATGELLLSEAYGGVTFTGSTPVGVRIRELATAKGARVQLELGGKNMAVVLNDADLACAQTIARAAFSYSGQKCTATSVVVAEERIRDDLETALADVVRSVPWGDPARDDVWGGPVIDPGQRKAIDEMIDSSTRQGAEVLARGPSEAGPAVVAPALVRAPSQDVVVAREEVFGPVLVVLSAPEGSPAEVVNRTPYGLAASVFGRDLDRVRTLLNDLQVGTVAINRMSTGLEVQAPSSGWKASGYGDPEQGTEAIRFFTKNQTVYWKSEMAGAEFP